MVIKLGGSLLTLPDWPGRLESLLAARTNLRPLLIVGGGAIVDEIRRWDQSFLLGEQTCHQLALDAMKVTAELAAHLIPRAKLVASRRAAGNCWSRREIPLLVNLRSLCRTLPPGWDVTSDSLAAEVARRWNAAELWLLKSTDWPPGVAITDASQRGLLDRYFPAFGAESFEMKWCNLRAASLTLQSLE